MWGRLSPDALPFYSAIAMTGAGLVVFGMLGVIVLLTITRRWGWLWRDWLTTPNHRKIGIMYVIVALVMLLRAFIEALLMRAQQAVAYSDGGFLPPEHFAQLFSTHGTIMIFFVLMPFLTGLINVVLPLQLGSRDLAFPWLNAIGLWLTTAAAGLMMTSLVIGKFSTGGWSGYPSYTGVIANPGVGPDYWIWALTLAGVGSTLAGINFIVTIWKLRAPGMKLMAMPLFCWTTLCTSLLMVFAFPALTVATSLLWLDRTFGFHFFTQTDGGNMMQFVNLFWMWGHPEVYILILPAFGVFSEVISTFAQKKLFGYASLVYATMAIGVLSFTVWLHHFFTMGASANVNAFFGIMTMIIAVPTGVKVYDWLFTMYRGRLRFDTPMLYAIGFLVTFVIGGVTGVLLAIPPVDFTVHNSVFLVAHFHNMLIPGALFGMFSGFNFWFPKAIGFRLDDAWGRRGFWFWISGFYVAFMPLYLLGMMGMSRRMERYVHADWQPWLIIAALGAALIAAGIVCQIIQLYVSWRRREPLCDRTGDPWDGRALEWSVASPPPKWNFALIPQVRSRDAFYVSKQNGSAYPAHPRDAYQDIRVPRHSGLPVMIGWAAYVLAFAAVWHIWWLAVLGIAVIAGLLITRSFQTSTHEVVTAQTMYDDEQARRACLRRLAPSGHLGHGIAAEGLAPMGTRA
ncbi:MAG: cbb3-type cytochrome c oxidase subunit I [Thiobacillus sp.]|nr:cbb3-type cytochrome c oxidase subunit I [Thiobacillus sp.]